MSLKSEKLFEVMETFIKEKGGDLVPKVKSIYRFEISATKGGAPTSWTVDLKNGTGSVKKSAEGPCDCTFSLLDADFMAMANKTLNPQNAFMTGKMKIKGNMAAATKFTPDLLPPMPKL